MHEDNQRRMQGLERGQEMQAKINGQRDRQIAELTRQTDKLGQIAEDTNRRVATIETEMRDARNRGHD